MEREDKGYGANIIEDPRRPGALYVWVYHQGRRYKRRAASLSHARDLVHEIKAAIIKGEWPPKPQPKAVLLDDLLDEYREAKDREGKAIMRSGIGFQRLLDRFGRLRPDEITAVAVEAWRMDLLERMSVASANHHLQLLRAILLHGVRNRRLKREDVPGIKLPNPNNQRVRYLTDGEERRLIAALPEYLHPLIVAAIHTGMRRGELAALKWSDVDFVSSTIVIREAKSGEGRRLPMNPVVQKTLAALRRRRRERIRARVVNRNLAAGYVFTGPRGGVLMNLNRDWYPALKSAALEDLHFHDLRHTFASRLVMAGVDLYRVQTLMGHKTPAMTLRYAHLSPAHLRAAVDVLAAPGPKPWAAKAVKR